MIMYLELAEWLDHILGQDISEEVVAFCFNLYEDEGSDWSVELVGTSRFDAEDDDWGCDEITDFGTREEPFSWNRKAAWEEILGEIVSLLKEYLEKGRYADVLKGRMGIGVGFVNGDMEIINTK